MTARMADVSSAHQRVRFRLLDWFDALPGPAYGQMNNSCSGMLAKIDADVILGADVVRRSFFAHETPHLYSQFLGI